MARVFQTGFETGSLTQLDLLQQGGLNTTIVPGAWSTYSYQGATGKTALPSTYTELYAGFRYYHGGGFTSNPILTFASPNDTAQCQLRVNTGGKLVAVNGNNNGTLGTGTAQLVITSWAYIEVHVVIHDSTGSFEVKVNGVVDQTLTSVDTRNDTGVGTCDRLWFLGDNNQYMDDLYVNSTTGSQNTGYSGDIRVSAYIPNAAGDNTGLTRGGSDSGNNYGQVDERPPNDATDYVFGTGTSVYDLYNIPNTSSVATVQAVTLWMRAQKSDAGAKNIAPVIKSGGTPTETIGSDQALSTSWTYYKELYNNEPVDNVAWTPSKVDSLQIGAKAR